MDDSRILTLDLLCRARHFLCHSTHFLRCYVYPLPITNQPTQSCHNTSIIITSNSYSLRLLVQKIPGGQNVQAFFGTAILLGFCAVPVFSKDTKAGHDLFSQEKPQAIVDSESQLRRGYMEKKEKQREQ